MESKLLQAMRSGRVLLMDGAMGTELGRAGIQTGECYEAWNLTHPDRVLAIHRAYVEAGAEVLLTNTFQANPVALAKHNLDSQLEELCRAGIALAREAAGSSRFVLGDVGPGCEALDALLRLGTSLTPADGLLLETLSDVNVAAISALREAQPNVAVLLSCTFLHNAKGELLTYTGSTPEVVAATAQSLGVAALGVNCGREIDMDDTIEIIRSYQTVTDLPLFARPNAGTPAKVDGHWVYPRTPDQMASKLPKLLEASVTMVGGCCGTTPAHIAACKPNIDEWNRSRGH